MYNRLGTTIALLMGAFPFLALGYKLFETSAFAGVVYAVIIVILVGAIMIAARTNIELPETAEATASAAPRPPAPPISWSWDGVDRQPDADDQETDDQQTQEHEA